MLMNIPPSAQTPLTTDDYTLQSSFTFSAEAETAAFDFNLGDPSRTYSPLLPIDTAGGSSVGYAMFPLLVEDNVTGTAALIYPELHPKLDRPMYRIGWGTTVGGTGSAYDIDIRFNRNLIAAETMQMDLTQYDDGGNSAHAVATDSIVAGGYRVWATASDTNSGAWTWLELKLTANLDFPIALEHDVSNNQIFCTITGDGVNYKLLTYNPRIEAIGPSAEDFQALNGLTANNEHALLGVVAWLVTDPTLGDSRSRITSCNLYPSQAGTLFPTREAMIQLAEEAHLGFRKGIEGTICISFPTDRTTYGIPGETGGLMPSYFQLDHESTGPLEVYFQWGICTGTISRQVWNPKERVVYQDKQVEALFELCSMLPSNYSNKNHLKEIKSQLRRVWNDSRTKKVRDMASIALKHIGPIAEVAGPALLSLL